MSHGSVPSISSLRVLPVIAAFEALGLDVPRILERARLTRAVLEEPQGRVPAQAELEVWQAAVEESGDPSIGLAVADKIRPGALGSFEYLLRHSETLEQLIVRAQRYGRLMDDRARLSVHVDGDVAAVRLSRPADFPLPPPWLECLFAITVPTARRAWPGIQALGVRFAHTQRDSERYRRHFGCPVYFASHANEILVDPDWLRQPARHADPNLGRVLEEHTRHLLEQLPRDSSFLEVARRALERLLAEGRAQAEGLAQALHVSERTLRRKLAAEGTSYQDLLDEIRREVGLRRVLLPEQSLEQLASVLGFADTSTFYRAFKRWTGTTPAQYRARKRQAD